MTTPPKTMPVPPDEKPAVRELPWEEIARAVQAIRYGTVQLIIQDGRVIQIDKTEKIRLVSP